MNANNILYDQYTDVILGFYCDVN